MLNTTFLIVDDHRATRESMRQIIERQPGVEVVGEAENGQEAVKMAAELRPDLICMDVGMPKLNGIDATRRIVEAHPESRVMMVSFYHDQALAADAITAGAKGFLTKDSVAIEFAAALQAIQQGQIYLTPALV